MNKYFLSVICAGMLCSSIPASQSSSFKKSAQQFSGVGIIDCFHASLQKVRHAKQVDLARSTTKTKNEVMLAQLELLCAFDVIVSSSNMSDEQKNNCAKQLSQAVE